MLFILYNVTCSDAIAFCTNVVSDFVKFSTASPTKARMPMDNLNFFISLKSLILNDYIISNGFLVKFTAFNFFLCPFSQGLVFV